MQVKLISLTYDAEPIMAYCARVSSPNQDNPDFAGLLSYCIRNNHWSVFEMANMVVEIETSRAISAQILRHRSFHFQEFSQRYAAVTEFEPIYLRRQDKKNRQNSTDDLDMSVVGRISMALSTHLDATKGVYNQLLELGVAKECARMILPMTTQTRLYMNGTIRDWIHYINLRTSSGTQMEHREVAKECKKIFIEHLPTVSEALGWED